jgi:16S rRNA (guanine966-N2)-methyltransferase
VRIVGGSARGRSLRAVPGQATRPTSDRVRQSLFDLLGQRCDGLSVLDLYAGTGALALEAISRGAARATLVEVAPAATAIIEHNARVLGFTDQVTLLRRDVARALSDLHARGARFDLVLADPPYALRASQQLADDLARLELLAPGGRAVLERGKREPRPAIPESLTLVSERTYGDTVVLLLALTANR